MNLSSWHNSRPGRYFHAHLFHTHSSLTFMASGQNRSRTSCEPRGPNGACARATYSMTCTFALATATSLHLIGTVASHTHRSIARASRDHHEIITRSSERGVEA